MRLPSVLKYMFSHVGGPPVASCLTSLCPTGGALLSCGRIAAATGAALLCENAFSRVDRGAGLPNLQRLPYFPQVQCLLIHPFGCLLLLCLLGLQFLVNCCQLAPMRWARLPARQHAASEGLPFFANTGGGGRTGPVRAAAAAGCAAAGGQLWV